MGIKGLSKLLNENCPKSIKTSDMKSHFGRKVAVDASMSIYQFLIAVRSGDGNQLQNEDGETTSHLMGMFYRTLRMIDNGIKPCYVFDGVPPSMKSDELAKRGIKRADAEAQVAKATEEGDLENMNKFSRRTVKVTKQHNEECQQLLELMGIPWVKAPGEAEAQCAALAKAGKVYGVGSEDMDTLTFAAPVLMRHLTFSEARKMPISEITFSRVLEGLELNHDEFIDLCILLGCDYCDSIKGIGPHKALQLIKEHRNIEAILPKLDSTRHPVPEGWPYEEARRLFKNPLVTDPSEIDLKWKLPDEEGLVKFLVTDRSFNEDRIRKAIVRLVKAKKQASQGRLDGFFKVIPNPNGYSSGKADELLKKKKGPSVSKKGRK